MFNFKVWAKGWHYVYAVGRFVRSAAFDMVEILQFGTGNKQVAVAVMANTAAITFLCGGWLLTATAIGLTYLAVVIKKGFEYKDEVVVKPKEKAAPAAA